MGERRTELPTTLAPWERALVERFLRADDNEDSSPLRAFEITGDTLATAFPGVASTGEEAEAAFRTAMRNDPNIWGALREGRRRAATASSPNCFAYLCMSLLIDTLLDGEYRGQGQYRDRLRTWLSTSRSMMQLSGIAAMWRDLAGWLDDRVTAGEAFRRLVLPNPRAWTQIGHTRRLSFPTRSDVRFLERVLASFPRGTSDPPGLIRAIDAAVQREGASWGMEAAFAEFRDAFRGGGASTDHRFWRLVLRAAGNTGGVPNAVEAWLEIEYDEDGCRDLRLGSALLAELGAAMRSTPVIRSANLAPAAARGIVFFRQVGMARWLAEAEPPAGLAHVGVAPAHAAIARGAALDLEPSGDWLLTTTPVPRRAVDDLLRRLRLLRQERLIDIKVEGGVRTAGGFLGRRRFLPHVNAANREVAIRAVTEQEQIAPARCVSGVIVSTKSLDGRYELSVSSRRGSDAPEWTRRVRFHRDAQPHADIGGAAELDAAVVEWTALQPGDRHAPSNPHRTWEELSGDAADLFEAIYAAGRTGFAESEIVDLISRGVAGAAAPWDVLRAIQEAGFVTARKRSRWRGRVWTLDPPRLVDTGSSILVTGATCAAMQEEFRHVAEQAGGAPFRVAGPSPWSPPFMGVSGVAGERLAGTLGWSIAEAPPAPRMLPGNLENSALMAEHHVLASCWDWSRRRFVKVAAVEGKVSLTRWVHPGGRDHDQYQVRSADGETRHATRAAAIVQAHIAASTALFSAAGGALARTAAEGALPLEIARWLRLRAGLGGGPRADGIYAYPLGDVSIRSLADALPGCIDGAGQASDPAADARATWIATIARSRRSGGRVRLRWSDGKVSAT